jgi:hypothetical protein
MVRKLVPALLSCAITNQEVPAQGDDVVVELLEKWLRHGRGSSLVDGPHVLIQFGGKRPELHPRLAIEGGNWQRPAEYLAAQQVRDRNA